MLAQRHALTTIQSEHRNLAEVLRILEQAAGQLSTGASPELLGRIGAALEYIAAFPDRFHHPKEEEYLFAALRRATHEGDAVLHQLEEEHNRGRTVRANLQAQFDRIRQGDGKLVEQFVAEVRGYVDYQSAHMRVEEQIVLPLAARTIAQDDWHGIAAAFLDDRDERFGRDARGEFAKLLMRVKSASVDSPK